MNVRNCYSGVVEIFSVDTGGVNYKFLPPHLTLQQYSKTTNVNDILSRMESGIMHMF